MWQNRGRRQCSDPPPGDGGGWFIQDRVFEAFAAPDQDGQYAGLLRGELQPAGRNQAEPPGMFGHDGSEPGMMQAFIHHQQHVLASLYEHDPVWLQSGIGEARGKQVRLSDDP